MIDWTNTKCRHGTTSGWALHTKLGERPCDACHRANQAEAAAAERRRLRSSAQMAAFKILYLAHPEEYAAAYKG